MLRVCTQGQQEYTKLSQAEFDSLTFGEQEEQFRLAGATTTDRGAILNSVVSIQEDDNQTTTDYLLPSTHDSQLNLRDTMQHIRTVERRLLLLHKRRRKARTSVHAAVSRARRDAGDPRLVVTPTKEYTTLLDIERVINQHSTILTRLRRRHKEAMRNMQKELPSRLYLLSLIHI